MPTTHLVLVKWITQNKDHIIHIGHWKKIKKYIQQEISEEPTAQVVFDIIYPEKIIMCNSARFISFSVGYRTCAKGCDCYVSLLSGKISAIKLQYTTDKKIEILQKRIDTTTEIYGVSNVFQSIDIKQKGEQTKIHKYGDSTFNNREKTKKTVNEKYQVDNVMQAKSIAIKNQSTKDYPSIVKKVRSTKQKRYGDGNYNNAEKAQQTNLLKYGVSNPSHSPEIKQKISDKLKSVFLPKHSEKYNITPEFTVDEYLPQSNHNWICNGCNTSMSGRVINGKFTRCIICNPKIVSIQEQEIKDFIKSLGFSIVENARDIISPKELDIYIPEKQLAIEYCGIYWHSEQHGKTKFYHRNKLDQCNLKNIRLLTIFSNEWIDHPEIVKSRISYYLGITTHKLFARQCTIKEVSTVDATEFLNRTHTQGYCTAKIRIGLYNKNNKLVSIMTFSPSRFEKYKTEMIRFSVEIGTSISGGASKLLSYFIKNYPVSEIVSYSNNNWGYTDFYEKLGFIKINTGIPGYTYLDISSGNCYNRIRYQKHKLQKQLPIFDNLLSEYQNMLNNNFDRFWDCGHTKYIMNITQR